MADPRLDPLGYGLSAYPDLTRSWNKSYGVQRVREAVIARLVDSYWWDPTFGVQVQERLARTNPRTWPNLAAECEAEIGKDDRIASVSVTITGNETDGVTIMVEGTTSTEESFSLVGSINDIAFADITFT